MWISDKWKDFEVIDAGEGLRLERWGTYKLVRPDPQVIWARTDESAGGRDKVYSGNDTFSHAGAGNTKEHGKHTAVAKNNHFDWNNIDGIYHRSEKGGGYWEDKGSLPEEWSISYDCHEAHLTFRLKPFAFKHTGIFPEQAVNWDEMYSLIKKANRPADNPVRVLNLFAYTGGATCALLAAGAHVTHVDASKGMVTWAKENAALSGLADTPARYLVDDCVKFVERELRRGNKYDAILLDPPSYGRGPKGEIWKIEESIFPLLQLLPGLLSDNPLFVFLNMYTTGLQAGTLKYILERAFGEGEYSSRNPVNMKERQCKEKSALNDGLNEKRYGADTDAANNEKEKMSMHRVKIQADELGLPVTASGLILPCGACGRVYFS